MQGVVACPEGHILALTEDMYKWRCDMCGDEGSCLVEMKVASWRCSEDWRQDRGGDCEYDLCTDCVLKYQVSVKGFGLGEIVSFSSYICVCQEKEEETALCALTGAVFTLQVGDDFN